MPLSIASSSTSSAGEIQTEETRHAVTSLRPEQASPRGLLRLWQAHWTIETSVRWVRDVVFGEDRATTRTAHAPQAFAALRNLAVSLLHRWHGPTITAARQYCASHPAVLLRRLDWTPRRL